MYDFAESIFVEIKRIYMNTISQKVSMQVRFCMCVWVCIFVCVCVSSIVNKDKSLNSGQAKLFIVPISHTGLHWSIKMYTGLPLVIKSVYWPIICHLYCMTSFFLQALLSKNDKICKNCFQLMTDRQTDMYKDLLRF